jgi:hypothetical protein
MGTVSSVESIVETVRASEPYVAFGLSASGSDGGAVVAAIDGVRAVIRAEGLGRQGVGRRRPRWGSADGWYCPLDR